ncbi:putative disease resistance protein RGA3 isoform X2 [Panicum virgatum]|uniref:putative disease resistance protein RGA3 isoform X2 n=1 Tax=Panicum virgatum TaxID=38727 RepID=UPI0019D565BB|nr:putative disease resistance protein RGA3 isoform X2 [Panicum virgatum]XP_039780957.1 putative disease resistance protein RGA3 isoform X2 [Panicum virgatum]
MKFLLVMDDVWSENVWYGLLRAPLSHGVSGSQVLVTTRSAGVALGMKAQHLHRVDKLQPEDSWILLKNQELLVDSSYRLTRPLHSTANNPRAHQAPNVLVEMRRGAGASGGLSSCAGEEDLAHGAARRVSGASGLRRGAFHLTK